jgi:hypothetical protein
MTKNEAKAILWYAYHLIILNRWWTGVYRLGWASKCLLPVGLPNSLHKLHYPLPHIWVWGNIDEWKQTCIHCNTTTRINRFYILFIYVYIYINIFFIRNINVMQWTNKWVNIDKSYIYMIILYIIVYIIIIDCIINDENTSTEFVAPRDGPGLDARQLEQPDPREDTFRKTMERGYPRWSAEIMVNQYPNHETYHHIS